MCRLPERTRPSTLAFGGLADGFLPFQAGGKTVELEMASVVMKAVQAHHPAVRQEAPCAGKIGDDLDAAKAQVGPASQQHPGWGASAAADCALLRRWTLVCRSTSSAATWPSCRPRLARA